jgi:hypothetical protein
MGSLLGGGGGPVEGGRGSLPSLPCLGGGRGGGGGEGGACAPSPLSPDSPIRGYRVLPCSVLMIRVGNPGTSCCC